MTGTLDIIKLLPLLIPLLAIQVGLDVYCIIDLVRRKRVRFNNKWIWAAIILLVNVIGAALYLAFRGDDEDVGD